jgi:hypothetical protein
MTKNNSGPRLTFFMISAVLAGFAAILIMNMASLLGVIPARYVSPNDVRGVAIEHHQKLYTLNFAQQNELIDILNRSIPVGQELVESRKVEVKDAPEVEKIIIYRFNAPDIEIIPVAYVSKTTSAIKTNNISKTSLVYSVPEWNLNGLLEESTSDELHKLLSSTYSP